VRVRSPGQPQFDVLDMGDHLLEQVCDVVVVELVHDLTAVAAADDKPQMAQQAELVGDRGALHLDGARDLAHRRRAGVQPRKDAQPAGGGERLHALGGRADEGRIAEQAVDVGIAAVRHGEHHS
jgi:hypothetical protein